MEQDAKVAATGVRSRPPDRFHPPLGFRFKDWLTWELAIDSAQTESLVILCGAGATIDAILAGLAANPLGAPYAVMAGISAALLVVGGAHLEIVNKLGGNKGVYWTGSDLEILGGVAAVAIHSQFFCARY